MTTMIKQCHTQLELEQTITVNRLRGLQRKNGLDPIIQFSLQQTKRELERIEQALDRLNQGNYGRCQTCDKKIDEQRLLALPYVGLCIQCQRNLERKTICTISK